MKQSIRAKRMMRNHKRHSKTSKLHLVSLMDIFTILVFFLMVNASEVQVMQNNKEIKLPKSLSKQIAEDNLVITVTSKDVLLQGRLIITVKNLQALTTPTVAALTTELDYQKSKIASLSAEDLANGLSINIMADQSVPYSLLKKIMTTSATAGYSNISLAVSQIHLSSSDPVAEVNES